MRSGAVVVVQVEDPAVDYELDNLIEATQRLARVEGLRVDLFLANDDGDEEKLSAVLGACVEEAARAAGTGPLEGRSS